MVHSYIQEKIYLYLHHLRTTYQSKTRILFENKIQEDTNFVNPKTTTGDEQKFSYICWEYNTELAKLLLHLILYHPEDVPRHVNIDDNVANV